MEHFFVKIVGMGFGWIPEALLKDIGFGSLELLKCPEMIGVPEGGGVNRANTSLSTIMTTLNSIEKKNM